MHREIINAMDIDELRNYVVHLEEQISACHGVVQNQKEIIDIQRRLISNMPFMYDAISFEEHRQYNLHQLEFALRSKYEGVLLCYTFRWEKISANNRSNNLHLASKQNNFNLQ